MFLGRMIINNAIPITIIFTVYLCVLIVFVLQEHNSLPYQVEPYYPQSQLHLLWKSLDSFHEIALVYDPYFLILNDICRGFSDFYLLNMTVYN